MQLRQVLAALVLLGGVIAADPLGPASDRTQHPDAAVEAPPALDDRLRTGIDVRAADDRGPGSVSDGSAVAKDIAPLEGQHQVANGTCTTEYDAYMACIAGPEGCALCVAGLVEMTGYCDGLEGCADGACSDCKDEIKTVFGCLGWCNFTAVDESTADWTADADADTDVAQGALGESDICAVARDELDGCAAAEEGCEECVDEAFEAGEGQEVDCAALEGCKEGVCAACWTDIEVVLQCDCSPGVEGHAGVNLRGAAPRED